MDLLEGWADTVFRVGEAFGTIGATLDGVIYEITTFRSDVYREDSRKPEVRFSDDIETDLSRRDFTINSMAIRIPGDTNEEPEMVDPFDGLTDLAAQVIRTPLDPEVRNWIARRRLLFLASNSDRSDRRRSPVVVVGTRARSATVRISRGETPA